MGRIQPQPAKFSFFQTNNTVYLTAIILYIYTVIFNNYLIVW